MKVRKNMEVRGAEVPRVVMMDVGALMSCLASLKNDPVMKEPRKTVTTCSTQNFALSLCGASPEV